MTNFYAIFKNSFKDLAFICLLILFSYNAHGQCTSSSLYQGGAAPAAGSTTTLTTCAFAGEYSSITSVAAATQYISSGTGGTGNYITIRQGTYNGTAIAWGFSPLTWTSTVAGTYYQHVHTTAGCGTDASCHTLTISRPAAGNPCSAAVNIPSAPVTNQSLVCTGAALPGNLNATNVPTACGGATNSYKGGQEALYTFTPTVTGSYTISYSGQSWSAIFVYSGACPASGGTCVGSVGSSATTQSLPVSLTSGVIYYIWFDTWPTPNSPCPGTFSISAPPSPSCTNTTLYPSSSFAAPAGGTTYTIASCQYQSEYNQMTGAVAGNTFVSTASIAGTYITVRAGTYNGTVVTSGTTPLSWTAAAGGTYFIHYNTNSSCGTASSCMTTTIQNTSACTTLVPYSGSNSVTTCNCTIQDHAGSGSYSTFADGYTVIYPSNAAQAVQLTGTYDTESCCDHVYIYNGVGTGGTLLGDFVGIGTLPATIISSGANIPLTVRFTSDGSIQYTGFNFTSSCVTPVTPPACASIPTSPTNGQTGVAAGGTTLSWPAVSGATGYDVYFGTTNPAPTLVSSNQAGTTYATGGLSALTTYYWRIVPRNTAGPASGCSNWSFTTNCTVLVPYSGSSTVTTCSCSIQDHAGSGNYSDSANGYTVISPSNATQAVQLTGTYNTESSYDYIYIYNGAGTGGTLLGTFTGSGSLPGTIISSGPNIPLTVRFTSDGSITYSGFDFTSSCITPPTPAYRATWVSMSTGSSTWCAGETRNISVTVQNTGTATWTNAGPDINIGVKWNADADYFIRVDANNLAPNATQTYNFTVTAPLTAGTNNLTFDVVNEGNCWFGNNNGSCGPGNVVYTSSSITISNGPTANAGPDASICSGGSVQIGVAGGSGGSTTFNYSGSGYDCDNFVIGGTTSGIPGGATITSIVFNATIGPNCTSWYDWEFLVNGSFVSTGCNSTGNTYNGLNGAAANGQLLQLRSSDNDVYCDFVTMTFDVTVNYTVPATTYSWSPTTGLSNPNIANPIASPTNTTTYTLTATQGGCSNSDQVLVTVQTPPVANAGADLTICPGTSTLLNGTAPGATSFSWSPTTGLSNPNIANPLATPGSTTTYTLTASTSTISQITYNQAFTQGVAPTTQATNWCTFRSQLLGSYTYTSLTVRGSQNPTGITLTDPVAVAAIANAMRTATNYSVVSGGNTWSVSTGCVSGSSPCSGSIGVVLHVNAGSCSCDSANPAYYVLRPEINNDSWGGINTATCSSPSQTMEVTFTYGSAGCSSTDQVVVTVADTTPPSITCPANISVAGTNGSNPCSTTVTYTAPTGNDNCSVASTLRISGLASGSAFPQGVNTVTYRVTDASGNTATCSFTVTVGACNAPPVAICQSISVNADANCLANVTASQINNGSYDPDNDALTYSLFPAGPFIKGTTNVTLTVSDIYGATATCAATVTVNDVTPPTFTSCPNSFSVNGDPDICAAVVTWAEPIAFDNCGATVQQTGGSSNGSYFYPGTYTISYVATDAANNTPANCSFTVTVVDNTPPTLNCNPQTILILLTEGSATISPYNVINPFAAYPSDACGNVTLSPESYTFTCGDLGIQTITLTAVDDYNNTSTCNATVNVTDNGNPTANCANITVELGSEGNVTIAEDAVDSGSFDNCGTVTFDTDINTFTCADMAYNPNTVKLTVTDNNGNTSSCAATVTVTDVTPPVANCPSNVTQDTDSGQCSAVVSFTVPAASDNCGATTVASPASGSSFNVGANTVTVTATDGSGNTGTCSFTVTVNDTQPPVANCPANISQPADLGQCSAVVSFSVPAASDNCGATSVASPASGSSFNVGANTVTVTATDGAGNTGTCSFTVTVNDTQPPVANCPANISYPANPVVCGSVIAYTLPDPSDNCGATSTSIPESGSYFNIGTTTVSVSAFDGAGNVGTCSFTVTIYDNQAPLTFCPSNVSQPADAGQCNAVVSFGIPDPIDNCGATSVASPASGSTFNVGANTVTVTATDGAGNTGTCSFTVTVTDNQAPVANCPANISQPADLGQCSAVVSFSVPAASDNCGATSVASPASGSTFNVGANTVTVTATDGAGNTGTCSFTVTVNDTQPPVANCPSNVSQNTGLTDCGAVVSYSIPAASDNCGATSVSNPSSGSTFNVGTNTVTVTATDGAGNTGTCSFTVTVIDVIPPIANCPSNISQPAAAGQCSAVVNFSVPAASDNCGATTVASPLSGSTFNVGANTVTVTATDGAGNTGTCSFTVTVNDTQSPVANCPSNISQPAAAGQCSAVVNFSVPAASDNCGATTVASPVSGSTFNVGANTVTVTATDGAGNTGTCSFTVTVNDTQSPVANCPSNISQPAAAGQCSAVVNFSVPAASDNCGATTVASPVSGSTFNVGTNTVTVTATDGAGNTGTCSFTVTVNDTQPPVANCPSNISQSAGTGQCVAVVNFSVPAASDNCGATSVANPASGSSFLIGTNTVTVTATDGSGNTGTCSFTVTVLDSGTPIAGLMVSISGNNNACIGYPFGLSATSAGAISYAWSGPNGFTANTASWTINNATTAMSGTYTVTVSNSGGCITTASKDVTITNTTPMVTGTTELCVGASLVLVASGGNTYSWAGPNGYTATGSSITRPIANTTMSGTYTVTVSNATGCTGVATIPVTVYNPPSATISGTTPVCTGGTISLSAPVGAVNYQWSGPGGYSAMGASINRNNASTSIAGTYTVTVTNAGGCTASASKTISVTASTAANITGATTACVGESISLTCTTAGATYAWSGPGGYSSSGAVLNIPAATSANAGTYTVSVTSASGCISTASRTITLAAAPAATIANYSVCGNRIYLIASGGNYYAWSGPNGYTGTSTIVLVRPPVYGTYTVTVTNTTGCSTTASMTINCKNGEEFTTENLIAYPNPTDGETTISFTSVEVEHMKLSVFSVEGREVQVLFDDITTDAATYAFEFDMHLLPSGTYYAVLRGEKSGTKQLRLMVIR